MPRIRYVFLPVLLTLAAHPALAQNHITYHVEPVAQNKTFKVAIDIPAVKELTVRVQMPVWMPGAYFVGNFANSVSDVHAADAGGSKRTLRVFHPDPNTWEVGANGAHSVRLEYTVKGADIEEEAGKPRRGHISGPTTYMYVVGRKTEPCDLEIKNPAGTVSWPTICSLDSSTAQTDSRGTSIYTAPTYDVLADAPVEMGDYGDETFEAGGKPMHVVVYGDYKTTDRAKLLDYCKKIANEEISFFGGAPFARYVFEFRTTSAATRGAGGLEHLGSTEIGTVGSVEDRVRSVIAHEFFHLWNVKRIRPFVLGPFNYVDPPHTANLWWSEGITSYYGDLLSERAGLNTKEEYLKHIADTIGQQQNNPGRLKVSADEASLRVWEANNSSGLGISYYTKGELIGVCLDLKLRSITDGKVTLDDVMKALWAQVRHGDGPGFGEDDIKKTVNRLSGQNLSDFYDVVARSLDELPLEECLKLAGLKLNRDEPAKQQGESGMRTSFDRTSRGIAVAEVTPGGAAETAGLKAGDKITGVNGSTEGRSMFGPLMGAKPGDKLSIVVNRGGTSINVEMTMGSRSIYSYSIAPDPGATKTQIAIRDSWLSGH